MPAAKRAAGAARGIHGDPMSGRIPPHEEGAGFGAASGRRGKIGLGHGVTSEFALAS